MSNSRGQSASSLIPPPTVSGAIPARPTKKLAQVSIDVEDASLKRVQRSLEQQLQQLLDAQSTSLSASLHVEGSTQQEQGHDSPSISLHHARHGILDTIRELSNVKAIEIDRLESESQNVQELLTRTSDWQDRKRKLEQKIEEAAKDESENELKALAEEEDRVQEQINAMEAKLSELRLHRSSLRARISQTKNSKEARLSSYQTSLATLDAEIQQFLRGHLPNVLEQGERASTLRSLPAKRRTLDMIREQLQSIQESSTKSQSGLEVEYEALTDGSTVWEEALEAVENFETALKDETRKLAIKPRDLSGDNDSPAPPDSSRHKEDSKKLFDAMHQTLATLQDLFKYAEDRGWTLLIASVSVPFFHGLHPL